MMDAYPNYAPTVAPSADTSSIGDLWDRAAGSQTVIWIYQRQDALPKRVSTVGDDFVFHTMSSPALAGLERLRAFEGWSANWDAEGSAAPNLAALDAASRVFSLLSIHAVPQVTLTPEGLPAFLYGGAINGEVVVTSASTIEYFFADDDLFEQDVDISDNTLPSALRAKLTSPIA